MSRKYPVNVPNKQETVDKEQKQTNKQRIGKEGEEGKRVDDVEF